jgi:hypothetical protein
LPDRKNFVYCQKMIVKPRYSDAPEFCHYYFDLVTVNDLMLALRNSQNQTVQFLNSIEPEKEDFRYSPEKWSIKLVTCHIIIFERLYTYWAFRFRHAYGESSIYYQEFFAKNLETDYQEMAENKRLKDLIDEFVETRDSTIRLFERMDEVWLDSKRVVNDSSLTARELGFLMVGHNIHHCNFIKNNYLT